MGKYYKALTLSVLGLILVAILVYAYRANAGTVKEFVNVDIVDVKNCGVDCVEVVSRHEERVEHWRFREDEYYLEQELFTEGGFICLERRENVYGWSWYNFYSMGQCP